MKKIFSYIFIFTFLIFTILFILSKFNFTILKDIISFGDSENKTTILKDDTDFLEWFKDFNSLYRKEKGRNYPNFTVNEEMFEGINNLLNNKESDTYYKDGKYFVSDNETLELDVNTRSFRYTKYKENNIIEITEVRLINGIYYIQLVDKEYIYRITFNKDNIDKITYINDKDVFIGVSIFQTEEFKW